MRDGKAAVTDLIHINADGSIDPLTAAISHNGDFYTFSSNISNPIIIEKDDIVVNGNGHFLVGTGPPYPQLSGWDNAGFNIHGAVNVTVRDVTITGFLFGVCIGPGPGGRALIGSDVVFNNTIMNNGVGVYINSSLEQHGRQERSRKQHKLWP
jgi:hypothetical protein